MDIIIMGIPEVHIVCGWWIVAQILAQSPIDCERCGVWGYQWDLPDSDPYIHSGVVWARGLFKYQDRLFGYGDSHFKNKAVVEPCYPR